MHPDLMKELASQHAGELRSMGPQARSHGAGWALVEFGLRLAGPPSHR
jgi:hypothetical protein